MASAKNNRLSTHHWSEAMTLNPYLNFNGNCEEAFKFYEKCLGGQILAIIKTEDTPMAGKAPPNMVMHARMMVEGTILMGSDSMGQNFTTPQGFSVTLNVAEPAEADRVFHDLSEGGTVTMPIQETFWAKRFGTVTDRFGTPWMVNCEKPMG
jgi:PhnB protein